MASRSPMPRGPDDRGLSPPETIVTVKALACERPTDAQRRPLSRFSVTDVWERAQEVGFTLSYSTVWRRLHEDALRPWLFQQWLFPRDPQLLEKAIPILELYHRRWDGQPLGPHDVVLSADEMSGLQAKSRIHTSLPPEVSARAPLPGRPRRPEDRRTRLEFEYERHGTVCYQAFLNVFTGQVYGEVHASNGIETFEATLARCLGQPGYRTAERIFLIVDNGSAHHPSTSPARIQAQHPRVTTLHLPIHSSWLNQVELYFSILHRKALTPADFPSVAALEQRLLWYQWYYNSRARPFSWQYSRADLEAYVERLAQHEALFAETAATLRSRRESAEVEHCLTN